jgi:hypothetical protein
MHAVARDVLSPQAWNVDDAPSGMLVDRGLSHDADDAAADAGDHDADQGGSGCP